MKKNKNKKKRSQINPKDLKIFCRYIKHELADLLDLLNEKFRFSDCIADSSSTLVTTVSEDSICDLDVSALDESIQAFDLRELLDEDPVSLTAESTQNQDDMLRKKQQLEEIYGNVLQFEAAVQFHGEKDEILNTLKVHLVDLYAQMSVMWVSLSVYEQDAAINESYSKRGGICAHIQADLEKNRVNCLTTDPELICYQCWLTLYEALIPEFKPKEFLSTFLDWFHIYTNMNLKNRDEISDDHNDVMTCLNDFKQIMESVVYRLANRIIINLHAQLSAYNFSVLYEILQTVASLIAYNDDEAWVFDRVSYNKDQVTRMTTLLTEFLPQFESQILSAMKSRFPYVNVKSLQITEPMQGKATEILLTSTDPNEIIQQLTTHLKGIQQEYGTILTAFLDLLTTRKKDVKITHERRLSHSASLPAFSPPENNGPVQTKRRRSPSIRGFGRGFFAHKNGGTRSSMSQGQQSPGVIDSPRVSEEEQFEEKFIQWLEGQKEFTCPYSCKFISDPVCVLGKTCDRQGMHLLVEVAICGHGAFFDSATKKEYPSITADFINKLPTDNETLGQIKKYKESKREEFCVVYERAQAEKSGVKLKK